jgi:hypothetical protein
LDNRNYKEKAKIGWCPGWMGERDDQGDRLGDWAEQKDSQHYRCRWCDKVNFKLLFF